MDRQEVTRARGSRGPRKHTARREAGPSFWTRQGLNIFNAVAFVFGFSALMLVIHDDLVLAGRVSLASMIFAALGYHLRARSRLAENLENEFSGLCDLLGFAIVPGLLLYRLAFQHWGILGLTGLFVVIFSGMLRLSLFRIYNPSGAKRYFTGIPLAFNAAFVALVTQLLTPASLTPLSRLGLLGLVSGLAFLTVSTLRYPNPAENLGLSALPAVAVVALFWGPPVAGPVVWLFLVGGAAYVLFAPWWVRERR